MSGTRTADAGLERLLHVLPSATASEGATESLEVEIRYSSRISRWIRERARRGDERLEESDD